MLYLTAAEAISVKKLHIGNEVSPLLVVDNFIEQTSELIDWASHQTFSKNSPYYPGVRTEAPLTYQQCLLSTLQTTLVDFFQLPSAQLRFSVCHFSVVTTPPEELTLLQRIPHFDSIESSGLAAVHYLFKADIGGTSFYRHRKTGFETINESRRVTYFRSLESENGGPNMPKTSDGYINGDTALYERIAEQSALFNRLIVYRRNALHSGSISPNFNFSQDPRIGRLTISSFIDCI